MTNIDHAENVNNAKQKLDRLNLEQFGSKNPYYNACIELAKRELDGAERNQASFEINEIVPKYDYS